MNHYLSVSRILLVLLMMSPHLSFSQIEILPGYIVKASGDTVKGFVENRSKGSDYKSVHFKASASDKPVIYTAADIVGFGIDNLKYYESITPKDELMKDQKIFGAILLPGRASIYKSGKDKYIKHDSLGTYSLHFNGTRDLIGMNKARGKLNFLFADCKKGKRIAWDSIILTDEKIFELTRNYNICKNAVRTLNVKGNVPALHLNVGALAGINISNLEFAQIKSSNAGVSTLQGTTFSSSSAPVYGLSFALSFPRFSSNFALYAEATFFKMTSKGHGSGSGIDGPETEDIAFSVNYFKTAYGVKILLPARSSSPFLKLGISNYGGSNFSGTRTRTITVNGAAVTQVTNPWTQGNLNGIWFGAGVQKKIAKTLALSLEGRYDRSFGFGPDFQINASNVTFMVGLTY